MNALLAADLTNGGGSSLASWSPVVTLLSIFGVATVALLAIGRSDDRSLFGFARRIPNALERLTGIPGWAAATVGMSLFGLLVAGQGFYDDVAWHVALGRDETLFTAPHTAIVVGLALIAGAAAFGTVFATFDRVDTRLRWGALRIPWSCALLGLLGVSAVAGFPLDDVWHAFYGVDVTMWSPTHMLMICGAALTGAASWLVLREAGVPVSGRWQWRAAHVLAAWFTFQGLVAPLGEFAFGVPQFDHVFHPLLLMLAYGVSIVAMRLHLGRFWALGITGVTFVLDATNAMSGELPAQPRAVGMYVGAALVVEAVAWLVGTERVARFAVAAGLGIGTVGMATEWLYNQDAYQPWRAALAPEALALGIPTAVAAALLGSALVGRRPRPAVLVASTAVVLFALAWPMPRPVGEARAALEISPAGDGLVDVVATLAPADAADDARWFQVSAWQGGTLEVIDMQEVAPGRWEAEEPVPASGNYKSILRLHRGHEMMTVPVFLPADPEIDEPAIPAEDREMAFGSEADYLLRETEDNDAWLAWAVYGLLAGVALGWIALFGIVTRHVGRPEDGPVLDLTEPAPVEPVPTR